MRTIFTIEPVPLRETGLGLSSTSKTINHHLNVTKVTLLQYRQYYTVHNYVILAKSPFEETLHAPPWLF